MINPRPDYSIGPATPADIDTIDRIEQEAFNTPWSRELLRAAIFNDAYRVRALRSEHDGVLGFYIAHATRERTNLDNLAVLRSVRSRGYGSELLRDWIEDALRQHVETLTLQVNTANVRAQKLYEQFEFRTAKLLVAYYPNGDDAYQMERVLPPASAVAEAPVNRRTWLQSRRRWPASHR